MAIITLYQTSNRHNALNKTLNRAKEIEGDFVDYVDVRSPVITFKVDNLATQDYNYVHIPDLARYYFIQNAVYISKNHIELSLKCDVLMSFKSYILLSIAEIRNQSVIEREVINDNFFNDNGEVIVVIGGLVNG